MSNPWTEWWEQTQLHFGSITSRPVLVQILAFTVALLAAFALDRLLEFGGHRWRGQSRLRAVIWAAKFPFLVLIYGYLVLAAFAITGRPADTLSRLVSVFWYFAGYMMLARLVTLVMPPAQARRIVRRLLLPILAVAAVLHVFGLLEPLREWASQWELHLGTVTIDGASLAAAIGTFVLFWLAARLGHSLMLNAQLPRAQTDPQLVRSASDFVQFAVIVAGFWVALSVLGLELSNLTLVVSALTVGIGFGLQDVIKNLMGGLIVLAERQVRPNDVFQISGQIGIVEHIGLRSTLLRCWDGTRVIIPNADLIIEKISDLTNTRRVEVKVGVSAETDPRRVEQLLLELAATQPDVVADPAPTVFFQNFGQNSHDFLLYCFVSDRARVQPTASALRYAVIEAFARQQIDMGSPQLSVHLLPVGPQAAADGSNGDPAGGE